MGGGSSNPHRTHKLPCTRKLGEKSVDIYCLVGGVKQCWTERHSPRCPDIVPLLCPTQHHTLPTAGTILPYGFSYCVPPVAADSSPALVAIGVTDLEFFPLVLLARVLSSCWHSAKATSGELSAKSMHPIHSTALYGGELGHFICLA